MSAHKAAKLDPSEVLGMALAWLEAGRKIALATVVKTGGSSPCPVGSNMVIAADGAFEGSVSGGCVEGAVVSSAETRHTRAAVAGRIDRVPVATVAAVRQPDSAARRKDRGAARVAGGNHAVEQIDSVADGSEHFRISELGLFSIVFRLSHFAPTAVPEKGDQNGGQKCPDGPSVDRIFPSVILGQISG